MRTMVRICGRGFVLQSRDYQRDGTLMVAEDVALTATIDILRRSP